MLVSPSARKLDRLSVNTSLFSGVSSGTYCKFALQHPTDSTVSTCCYDGRHISWVTFHIVNLVVVVVSFQFWPRQEYLCCHFIIAVIPNLIFRVMEVSAPHFLNGRWTLESRENVDAFLAERGAGWIVRKIALGLQADLEYEFRESQGYISFGKPEQKGPVYCLSLLTILNNQNKHMCFGSVRNNLYTVLVWSVKHVVSCICDSQNYPIVLSYYSVDPIKITSPDRRTDQRTHPLRRLIKIITFTWFIQWTRKTNLFVLGHPGGNSSLPWNLRTGEDSFGQTGSRRSFLRRR